MDEFENLVKLPISLKDMPWSDIVASSLLILFALVLRWFLTRMIRRGKETLSPEQRKWLSTTQNATILLILIGLLFVWSLELSRVALSLAAFAVAIVIASKEVILCVTGGIYRAAAKPFEVGDWIEVGEYRGEVLHEGLLTTRIQELSADGDISHAHTGRDITVPNAFLLLHPVIDLNFNKRFIFHTFDIVAPEADVDAVADLDEIKKIVNEIWQCHSEVAERYWRMVRRKSGVDLGHPAPQVNMSTTDIGHIRFHIVLFCPRETAAAAQTDVTVRALARIRARRQSAADAASAD